MNRKLPLEQFLPISQTTPEIVEDAVTAFETYKSFFLAGNWELVRAQIIPLTGYADLLLRTIQSWTELHEHWAESLSEQDSMFKNAFADLKNDNSAEADTVRATMLTQFTASLGDEAAAQKFLKGLLEGDNPLFSTRMDKKSALSKEQGHLIVTQTLLATVAYRASMESSTYSSYNMVKGMDLGPEGGGDTSIISNETSDLSNLHDEIIHELFHALTSDTERQSFVNLCVGRQAQIETRLPTSAMLFGGYLALLIQNGPSADLSQQYQAVLELVERIKRLSLLHAYLSLVRAEAATIDPGRWYSFEKKRAISRQMESEVPSGQATGIDAILGGAFAEGDFIQIEGFVEGLAIEDDPSPPKFSSFFDLIEKSSNTKIRIRAHMFSLANNGLSDGTFVRLNGFVRTNPNWNNAVGIDIDRVSLTELRKSSWYDDMTHRVKSNFLLYQDGMNMFFTPPIEEN